MQITESGKRVVTSPEFAEHLKKFLVKLHSEDVPDDFGSALAVSVIAWALTGHDYQSPPQTEDELEALRAFCDSHASEIDAASGAILINTVKHDTGGAEAS